MDKASDIKKTETRKITMSLQNRFDLAKKASEKGNPTDGYITQNGRLYSAYLTNTQWENYKSQIPDEIKNRYVGGGNEMIGNPPPMASYGSSSRFILSLLFLDNATKVDGFLPEQPLNTRMSGVAKMDGVFPSKFIFIESKCREPYASCNPELKSDHEGLYRHLRTALPTLFDYIVYQTRSGNNRVRFLWEGRAVGYFDFKQVLCHLAGIFNYCVENRPSKAYFVYLLYEPTNALLDGLSKTDSDKIRLLYNNEIGMIDSISLCIKQLFLETGRYLFGGVLPDEEIQSISSSLTMTRCNQYNCSSFINSL